MSELLVRTLSALVMVVVALGAVAAGGNYLAVMVGVIALTMYFEWLRLVRGWNPVWNVAGFFYALAPALGMMWIRNFHQDGIALVMWTFIVTWSTDIGAYFAGRRFGGAKLAPSISPNKTRAGLYGGIVAAGLGGAAWVFGIGLEQELLLMLAPPFAILAQGGDLFESWMKRKAGVKDSANWLPGHGGLLDRLDGFVPVVTVTALLLFFGAL